MTARRDRDSRRNRNSDEMYAAGFTELRERADEDGWPYPDVETGEESTEHYMAEDPRTGRYYMRHKP